MATVQQKLPEQESGLMDLLKIFSAQLGGGKTTTTTSSGPQANANAQDLLAQIKSGANPELLQQMAASILDKANQQVAPAIGASIGAGNRAYSDTALQDSIARARAYATEAIAKANLDFIAEGHKTSASIINSQLASNRVSSQVTEASTLGKIGSLGAGALGVYGLAKKLPKLLEGMGKTAETGISAATAAAGMGSGIDQIEWTGSLDVLGDTAAGIADTAIAEGADFGAFGTTASDFGVEAGIGDFTFPGMGSAFNLLSGNNPEGAAGEGLVLAMIPGVGPILSLANALDVPVVSDVVDVAGDIVSDLGDAVGCFITTAVIKSTGKPDDCFELQTLRRFRDTYMQEHTQYRAFIAQYYHEAPELVKELEALKNKRVVYFFLYASYILPAIYAIRNEKNQIALELYASMFYMVKHIILGHPREDISEIAQGA